MEDCNYLYTCPNIEATKINKKGINGLLTIPEKLDIAPELQKEIFGGLKCVRGAPTQSLIHLAVVTLEVVSLFLESYATK